MNHYWGLNDSHYQDLYGEQYIVHINSIQILIWDLMRPTKYLIPFIYIRSGHCSFLNNHHHWFFITGNLPKVINSKWRHFCADWDIKSKSSCKFQYNPAKTRFWKFVGWEGEFVHQQQDHVIIHTLMMKECEHWATQMGFVRTIMTIFIFHQGVFYASNTSVHLLKLCVPHCVIPVVQIIKKTSLYLI